MIHTWDILTDTANATVDLGSLGSEIEAAGYTFRNITQVGNDLNIDTDELKTNLDSIVSAHTGDALPDEPQQVEIATPTPAFANKYTLDGKSLYARERGVAGVSIDAGQTSNITHTIAFPQVKINGAAIFGCQLGDTVNFKVLDSTTGTYTTVPNYQLNQFGYDVNMPDGKYEKQYPYDADLYQGMQVVTEYTNNGTETITVYVNLDIHEVK